MQCTPLCFCICAGFSGAARVAFSRIKIIASIHKQTTIAQKPLAAHTTTTLHALVHTSPHYVPVLTVITVRRTDDHVLERLLVHRKDCSTIQTTLLARRPNKPLKQIRTSRVPYYCQVTGYLLLFVGKPISFERCPPPLFSLEFRFARKKRDDCSFFFLESSALLNPTTTRQEHINHYIHFGF